MERNKQRSFIVLSFNVWELPENTNKEELVRHMSRYIINIYYLQETKIKEAGIHMINGVK